MKKLFFTFVLSMLVAQISEAQTAFPSGLKISKVDKSEFDLSEHVKLNASNGVISVVIFWATWNSPGKLALNSIHDNYYKNWKEKYNIELIAISLDDARNNNKVRPYVEGKGWVYEIGMDPNGVTSDLKGDSNLPLTLIVDKENNIALRHEGFEPGQESIFEETFAKL